MDLLGYYNFLEEFEEHGILTYTSISIAKNYKDFFNMHNEGAALISRDGFNARSIRIKAFHNEFIKYINRSIEIMKRNNRERCFIYIKVSDRSDYMKIILSKTEADRLIQESRYTKTFSFYYRSNKEEKFSLTGIVENVL